MNNTNTTTREQLNSVIKIMQDAGIPALYLQKTPGGVWRIAVNGGLDSDIVGKTKRELFENAWAAIDKVNGNNS